LVGQAGGNFVNCPCVVGAIAISGIHRGHYQSLYHD
jgi:hypothetical protein